MPAPNTETVKLLRDLEFRGVVCPAGTTIEITQDLRPRLERNGYIEPRTPYPRGPADLETPPPSPPE